MATYKTPGVYIEETRKFPHSFAQEPTSVVAFIGYTTITADNEGNSILLSPKRIRSWNDFVAVFGYHSSSKYLPDAVSLFYTNGGGDCYIISVGAVNEPVSLSSLVNGLNKSKEIKVQLIVIPDACLLPSQDFYDLQKQTLASCNALQDRFAIIDTQQPAAGTANDSSLFRAGIGNDDLKWGAAYYPWLVLADGRPVPPSGAIAGIYNMVDNNRGVWKAPANVSLSGAADLTVHINNDQQNDLTIPIDGKAINAIRVFAGKGLLVWGARTLDGNSQDWRYLNVRRTITMIENSIKNSSSWVVFEPNDAKTWILLRAIIENFLTLLWREGALAGAKPEDAFDVQVGLGSTMTASDILEGRLVVTVKLAVLRPAEFIMISFVHKMQQS